MNAKAYCFKEHFGLILNIVMYIFYTHSIFLIVFGTTLQVEDKLDQIKRELHTK